MLVLIVVLCHFSDEWGIHGQKEKKENRGDEIYSNENVFIIIYNGHLHHDVKTRIRGEEKKGEIKDGQKNNNLIYCYRSIPTKKEGTQRSEKFFCRFSHPFLNKKESRKKSEQIFVAIEKIGVVSRVLEK